MMLRQCILTRVILTRRSQAAYKSNYGKDKYGSHGPAVSDKNRHEQSNMQNDKKSKTKSNLLKYMHNMGMAQDHIVNVNPLGEKGRPWRNKKS